MNLRLFHSYNYVKGKYKIKEKTILGKNNKPLFDLKNIPDTNEIYSIWIENILSKKKFSYKSNNNSYYTKHNIKIFLEINYQTLNNYVMKNISIPDINLIFNLLLKNNELKKNKLLLDLIDNHKYVKNISSIENKLFAEAPPYNFYFKDLEFDIENRKIIKSKKKVYKKLKNILFLSDMYYETLLYFSEYKKNNMLYLVIVDTFEEYKKWYNLGFKNIVYSENISRYKNNNYFDKIFFQSEKLEILYIIKQNFLYSVCIIIRTNLHDISIIDFINLYNLVYETDINYTFFSTQILIFMLETTIVNKFLDKLILNNRFKIKNQKYISNYQIQKNIYLKQITDFKFNNLIKENTKCMICYNEFNIGNICELGCEHLMCVTCINKINIQKDNILKCPFCIKKTNINKLFVKKKDLLNTRYNFHFDIRISQLIMDIKKEIKNRHDFIGCICNKENLLFIRNILDSFNFKNIGVSIQDNYCLPRNKNSISLFIIGDKKFLNTKELFKNYIHKLVIYYIYI